MTDEGHEEVEGAKVPLTANEVGSAIAEGLGLDPDQVISIEFRVDARDHDNVARVMVEMLPTGLSAEQWREWAKALPVALVIRESEENPYETKPLPPSPHYGAMEINYIGKDTWTGTGNVPPPRPPVRPKIEPTGGEPLPAYMMNPPWRFLVVFFRWLGDFVRERLGSLLLTAAVLGVCAVLALMGLGLGRWAALAMLITSLTATCWVIMSLGGVFGPTKGDEQL